MEITQVHMPYGDGEEWIPVPSASLVGVFEPREAPQATDQDALVRQALARPIGTPPLRKIAKAGQKVVIVTSDLTRPCPSERLLPPVLAELSAAGVEDENITVVVALGLHRPMSAAELEQTVGPPVYRRVRVINHDPEDTVGLGVTSAGTPVELFRPVVEADLRVCLGNLELHYFAGYSGGAKAILPGCASPATVTANHAMMVRPEAVSARIDGNPVRADIEEGAAMIGVDFILNVLVDGHRHIEAAVAGEVTLAHRKGCELVAEAETVVIPHRADVVLLSAGGHPKDMNLYQAQKGLDNAASAVRDGGIIVWAAECREGLGNSTFEAWMREADSPQAVLARIQREFVLGGHKAAAVADVLCRARVYLVSGLPDETVEACGMVPYAGILEAVQAALDEKGPQADVIALPYGGSVLPIVEH
jgi:nickel-dependent lactate racemase